MLEGLGGYRLTEVLGTGGQGTVYLGLAPDGGKAAVKVLHAHLIADPEARRRFLREVSSAQSVEEFSTARVLGMGEEDGRPYVVSEYVQGVSLQQLVVNEGPRDAGGLRRLAIGTAAALAAIHRAGVVHRDFKPSNVLLGADGPRVIDFGIARALQSTVTMTSGLIGTPAYMSPEQVAGDPAGPPADVFAWGLTLLYAATGEPAFGNDSVPAVWNRVLNQHPDLSALPPELRDLVAACLAKRPEQRPTAQQVVQALLSVSPHNGQAPPVVSVTPHNGQAPPAVTAGRLIGTAAGVLTRLAAIAAVLHFLVIPLAVAGLTSLGADPRVVDGVGDLVLLSQRLLYLVPAFACWLAFRRLLPRAAAALLVSLCVTAVAFVLFHVAELVTGELTPALSIGWTAVVILHAIVIAIASLLFWTRSRAFAVCGAVLGTAMAASALWHLTIFPVRVYPTSLAGTDLVVVAVLYGVVAVAPVVWVLWLVIRFRYLFRAQEAR